MKKLILTIAIVLGIVMGSFAQNQQDNGDLFHRGRTLEGGTRDGGTYTLCFPGHNFTTHWNGGSQGHDDNLLPLGSGALLLMGFGAAYALAKRNKKDAN
jgi:hypothetical protein